MIYNPAMKKDTRLVMAFLSRLRFAVRGLRYGARWKKRDDSHAQPARPGRLKRFYDSRETGRGIWKWSHYLDAYEKHFNKFVGCDAHILEVGIYSGGSLEMWKNYFGEHCTVYGVDIEPACKSYEDDHTHIFIGDQASREFWREVKNQIPPLDIVIDDGGHEAEQQIVTLEEMLPHLKPGGIYACEDIHGAQNPFHLYLMGLAAQLNAGKMRSEGKELVTEANAFQSRIASIRFFPYLCMIETREQSLEQLECRRRGDQWQPFL